MKENSSPPHVDMEKDNEAMVVRDEFVASSSTAQEGDGPKPHLHAKTFLAITAMGLIYFAQLVSLVGAGAQGQTIAGHFGKSGDSIWFSAAITIFTVVLGPIVSQAADYWGRKWFLVGLTFCGAIGSVIVSRATTINMAIAGFCVIGLSFGAQPLLHTVTSEVLPRRYRAYGQAVDMASVGLGSICGLLVGGALNRTHDPNGFRYYYYMTMAWYIIASGICAYSYSPPMTPKQIEFQGRLVDKLRMLDWIGYALLAAGLVLFCVGLAWSQNPYPWTDARVAGTFSVGLGLAVCLIIYETWFKKDGMFHHQLFKHRNFAIALFCISAEGAAFFAANTYCAFQVSVLYESDSLIVGVRYSITFICSTIGGLVAGWYCAITRRSRFITVLAFVLFAVFFACMAASTRSTSQPTWGYVVLLGFALGMTLTTLITTAQLSTPPQLISTASGLVISVRSLGGTISLAIYQAIFINQLNSLPASIATAVTSEGLASGEVSGFVKAFIARNSTALEAIPGVNSDIIQAGTIALEDTYVSGFRYVWTAACGFVILAVVGAVFLQDIKKEFNMHIDAPVENEEDIY
ncbi:Fc.00g059810.m01.CDS01 [Cosmosporella sp. VM-42]